jgi:hypothetical protein
VFIVQSSVCAVPSGTERVDSDYRISVLRLFSHMVLREGYVSPLSHLCGSSTKVGAIPLLMRMYGFFSSFNHVCGSVLSLHLALSTFVLQS